MKLHLTFLLVCSSILGLAQSAYQSTAGYRPPRQQRTDTTTVREEKALSAAEVYILKLYYKKEMEQKDVALEQYRRDDKRLQTKISNLTDLNQEDSGVLITFSSSPRSTNSNFVLRELTSTTGHAYDDLLFHRITK